MPNGRYWAQYIGPDAQRYSGPHTWDAKVDAEGWLAGESRLIQLNDWLPPEDRDRADAGKLITLREFAVKVIGERDLAPKTRWLYDGLLDDRVLPVLGDATLAEITPATVRTWWAGLPKHAPTRNTQAYNLLKSVLSVAVDDGLIRDKNPCQIKSAGKPPRAKDIELLTLEELARVTAMMPAQYRAAVPVAAWCGLRFGELIELRRKDIRRLDGRMILKIQRAATRIDGKIVVGDPKSEAGFRDVNVPPHVQEVLEAHLKRYAAPGPEAFVFRTTRGKRLSQASFSKQFKIAVAEIGKPHARVHDLRHVGAVLAAQAGATTKELMARLGHTTPGMSMRYQHAAADRDAAIADRLSGLAGWVPADE